MDSRYVLQLFTVGVSPFGNLRIDAYLQLPAAYRSSSRPSSAPDAKAFTLRSCSLELPIAVLFTNCLSFSFELFRFLCEKASHSRVIPFFSFVSPLRFTRFGEIGHQKGGKRFNASERIKPFTAIWIPIKICL